MNPSPYLYLGPSSVYSGSGPDYTVKITFNGCTIEATSRCGDELADILDMAITKAVLLRDQLYPLQTVTKIE